jgi:protein phosphatase
VHKALAFVGGSYEETSGMQATLSMCWFTPRWMFFGHIGDSRIYYLPATGGLRQLTQDDTYVGWLYRTGQINEREARQHPRRTVLQKALGAGNQFVDPQVGAVAYEPGDMFLLCTDGLVEGLYDEELLDLLRPTASAPAGNPARELVHLAVEKSGRDNTTAVVVEVVAAPPAGAGSG